jgi:hypothetical protein
VLKPAAAVLTSSTEVGNFTVKSLWQQLLMALTVFHIKQKSKDVDMPGGITNKM